MPRSVVRTSYFTLLLLCFLFGLFPAAAFAQQQVKVGAWNIQSWGP